MPDDPVQVGASSGPKSDAGAAIRNNLMSGKYGDVSSVDVMGNGFNADHFTITKVGDGSASPATASALWLFMDLTSSNTADDLSSAISMLAQISDAVPNSKATVAEITAWLDAKKIDHTGVTERNALFELVPR